MNFAHSRFGLTGRSRIFDRRTVAIRPDLADVAVAGQYFAPHYAAPMMTACLTPRAAMRAEASLKADQISELLYGEAFALLDITGGWAWGYSQADHRVGYVAMDALGPSIAPTHRTITDDVIIHAAPDAASGGSALLPRGALLNGAAHGEWLAITNGYVCLSDVENIGVDAQNIDVAARAEALLDAPYVAGGRCSKGVDATGLVQISFAAAGIFLPRDLDSILAAVADAQNIEQDQAARGDLLILADHIGIMASADEVVHACRERAAVRREKLADLIQRRQDTSAEPSAFSFKRLI